MVLAIAGSVNIISPIVFAHTLNHLPFIESHYATLSHSLADDLKFSKGQDPAFHFNCFSFSPYFLSHDAFNIQDG
jgi:hypothetical protein